MNDLDLRDHSGGCVAPVPAVAGPIRLRLYQEHAISELHRRRRAGARRILVVAPTGSGKTVIATHVIGGAVAEGVRVLFLAHRRELINQAYGKLRAHGLSDADAGVLMASDGRRRPGARVQVASVDTLRRRVPPLADLVFIDECHRALAKVYRDISAQYPNALHVGLTATPFRRDGGGLGDAYDEMIVVATPRQLIADGYLVEPRVFTVPREERPDVSRVRQKGDDYDEAALAAAVDRPALVGNIVKHWAQHAGGVRTVVFAVSIAHSKHIVESFRAAGIAAAHLDGTMPTAERDRILGGLDRGEVSVVSSCGILSEGWDQPSVKCAILARPTQSTGLYLQQVGRILRPWNGVRAIILDHAGCVHDHGLPHETRVFSLDPKVHVSRAAPVRACPQCQAALALSTRVCPECGVELIAKKDLPEEAEGALVEVGGAEHERVEWERLTALALARGYHHGWAAHRFRELFGKEPPLAPRPRPTPSAPRRRDVALREALAASVRAGRALSWAELDRIHDP